MLKMGRKSKHSFSKLSVGDFKNSRQMLWHFFNWQPHNLAEIMQSGDQDMDEKLPFVYKKHCKLSPVFTGLKDGGRGADSMIKDMTN